MNKKTDHQESVMGHDPLAWIAVEDTDDVAPVEEEKVAPASIVDEATPEHKAEEEVLSNVVEMAEQAASGTSIVLDGDVGIANINTLHVQLQEALQTADKITVQASELSHVDTAAVQLLYAFVRDAKKVDVEVVWKGVPDSLHQTIAVLDLTEKMGM